MRAIAVSSLHVVDWTEVTPERMAVAYARETERWSLRLGWDTTSSWLEVERGRVLGTVRGWAAIDDGRVAGWCYYLTHRGSLQIGGFVAESDSIAQALLDRIPSRSPGGPFDASRITFFAFADAPGLPPVLRARGLGVERYWYLTRELQRPIVAAMAGARPWITGDVMAAAELLRRSYEPTDPVRPFCPTGTAAEWTEYMAHLTIGTGCGEFLPECSLVVPAGPGRLAAMALVTRLSDATAHLAQIAVDPSFRRRGLAGQLLEVTASLAARRGYDRLTLLVGGRNTVARRFYESNRFRPAESFLAAGK